jgi:hypothetical protein
MSYVDDPANEGYSVEVDFHQITDDTMTDAGIRVGDLAPVGDVSLTPGDPSPVGRDADGDLTYAIHEEHSYIYFERQEAAELAHIYAKAQGFTDLPKVPLDTPAKSLMTRLMNEAVPPLLFGPSNHQQVIYDAAVSAVFNGDWENYPSHLGRQRKS